MRSKRLVWQLFPSYLLITLLALLAVGWFAADSLQQSHRLTVRNNLQMRANLIDRQAAVLLEQGSDSEAARRFVDRFAQAMATRVTIVRPSGEVVYDSRQSPKEMDNHADRAEIRSALASGIGESTHYSETLGEDMMYVAVRVDRDSANNDSANNDVKDGRAIGVVRTSVSIANVQQAVNRVRVEVAAWGVLVAVLAGAISWYVSRRIARPLEEMRRGAERFAAGDLQYRMPIPDSAELASLAISLNATADELAERIATITQQSSQQDVVLASMAEGVLAVDADQRIIAINAAATRLLECSREQSLGQNFRQVVADADLRRIVARVAINSKPIEEDMTTRGSVRRVVSVRATPITGATPGGNNGVVVMLNDVTIILRLETLRRDFVANVSHELRTPIASIKGFVETLLEGAMLETQDAERFLHIIDRQTDRLGAIVEDLLSLAKIEQREGASDLETQRHPLLGVLLAAADFCQTAAEHCSVTIRVDCDGELSALLNAPLMEQAVINLLDNAVKYSDEGGVVTVRACSEGDEVLITVEDHGSGIAAEHLPRLFERFYRVDKARSRKLGGTGLGLAIVKHVVLAHGGRVSVQSTPGEGSTFRVHLPQLN